MVVSILINFDVPSRKLYFNCPLSRFQLKETNFEKDSKKKSCKYALLSLSLINILDDHKNKYILIKMFY